MSRARSGTQPPHTFSPSTFKCPDKFKILRVMPIGAYGIVVFEYLKFFYYLTSFSNLNKI